MQFKLSSIRLLFPFIFSFILLFSFSKSVNAQADLGYSKTSNNPTLENISNLASQNSRLRGLFIEQNEEILLSQMFGGRSPTTPFNIKSASKSIISILVGIAIQEGFIPSIDEPISTYFGEYFIENPDPKKEALTIRHLLSMQLGLETTSFRNYGRWVISDNWAKFALNQPFTEEPGGKMVYSTGTSHLLSVIITKASGMSTREFANKYLFDPMDISIGGWDRDPQGYYMGGNNVAMKPADMLKIGRLMLNEGLYEGKQIINKEWVNMSLKTYTESNFNPYDYGFMWWNKPIAGYKVYFAWGFGGQYIFMIPDLDSVIVVTTAILSASQNRDYNEPVFELLERQIIPYLSHQIH